MTATDRRQHNAADLGYAWHDLRERRIGALEVGAVVVTLGNSARPPPALPTDARKAITAMTPSTHDAAGRPVAPGPHDGGAATTQHLGNARCHVTAIVVACGPDCAHPGSLAVDISDEYVDEDATGMLLLIGDEDDGRVYLSVQDREPVVLTRTQAEQAGWQLLARANARQTRPGPTITHGPTDRGFHRREGNTHDGWQRRGRLAPGIDRPAGHRQTN